MQKNLPTIEKPAVDLLKILSEWNLPAVTQNLESDVKALQSEQLNNGFVVDMVFYGNPDKEILQQIPKWIKPGENIALPDISSGKDGEATVSYEGMVVQYRFLPESMAGIRQAGGMRPVWLIAVLCPGSARHDEHLKQIAEDYAAILLLNTDEKKTWSDELVQSVSELCLYAKITNSQSGSADEFFLSDTDAEQNHLLKADAGISGLETVAKTISLFIEKEERGNKGKKAISQQKLIKLQNSGLGDQLQELPSKIKNLINQQLGNLDRGINENLLEFFKPKTGEYYNKAKSIADKITEFEETKKSKTVELILPPQIIKEFVGESHRMIYQLIINNLKSAHDTFAIIEKEIEKISSSTGIAIPVISFRAISDNHAQSILENVIDIEKPYSGELPIKGAYEYFMAVRKYQMLFFMMASTLGLSFLRNLMVVTIPITLGLLGFGIYNVMISVEKERKDKTEKELRKARESLMNEAKRISTEISRQWGRYVSDHLRSESTHILDDIEQTIKSISANQKKECDEEKKRLQRLLQGFEQTERTTELVKRNLASWQRLLAKTRNDIKIAYYKTTENPSL